MLRAFGFDEFTFNLSTKDPDKFVGTDDGWEAATSALRQALETHGLEYSVKEGDAAFYGPKIDIDVRDAIGRSWQLSTIQYDFNMNERFGLEYVGADNGRHRPIMLHRALLGSVERSSGCSSSTTPARCRCGCRRYRSACCPCRPPTRSTPRRWSSASPGSAAAVTSWPPPTPWASASAAPRWRRSPTSSSSAMTTSPPAPSGSTRAVATVERGVELGEFVTRFTEELALAAHDALSS